MKMNNQMIEKRLKQAIESKTPNVLPQVLHSIETKKGGTIEMDTTNLQTMPRTLHKDIKQIKSKSWLKWTASIAAIFIISVAAYFINSYYTPQSIIAFDVNPSIELKVNKSEKVIGVTPLNKDAHTVIDGMDLKRVDLNTAVNALIGSMVKHGYISEIKNSILISVDSINKEEGIQLQNRLSSEIDSLLSSYSLNGAVLAQTVSEDDRIKELANRYDISFGKAALIDLVVNQENNLQYEDLVKLSINDINLLITTQHTKPQGVSSSGQASNKEYIGEDKAKSIAYSHAGVDGSIVRSIEIKMDYDDGKMVYDIEFYADHTEYEYEIDAINGTILEYDHDSRKRADSSNKNNSSSEENKATKEYIGKEEAKNIAFKHANVSESSSRDLKIELDRDDGRMIYEIEFDYNNMEYEYEIDAYTGEIIKWQIEND